MARCGIIFQYNSEIIHDIHGCVLPDRHDGPHRFTSKDKKWYEWELDDECTSVSSDPDDWDYLICEIQSPISEKTYHNRFIEYDICVLEIYDAIDCGEYGKARKLAGNLDLTKYHEVKDLLDMIEKMELFQ